MADGLQWWAGACVAVLGKRARGSAASMRVARMCCKELRVPCGAGVNAAPMFDWSWCCWLPSWAGKRSASQSWSRGHVCAYLESALRNEFEVCGRALLLDHLRLWCAVCRPHGHRRAPVARVAMQATSPKHARAPGARLSSRALGMSDARPAPWHDRRHRFVHQPRSRRTRFSESMRATKLLCSRVRAMRSRARRGRWRNAGALCASKRSRVPAAGALWSAQSRQEYQRHTLEHCALASISGARVWARTKVAQRHALRSGLRGQLWPCLVGHLDCRLGLGAAMPVQRVLPTA